MVTISERRKNGELKQVVVVKNKSSVFKNSSGQSGMYVGFLVNCYRSLRIVNDVTSSPTTQCAVL